MTPLYYTSLSLFLLMVLSVNNGHCDSTSSTPAHADSTQKAGKVGRSNNNENSGQDEIRMLNKLLDMPNPRLRKLRETIERIEQYSHEERETMKKKLAQFQQGNQSEQKESMKFLMRRHFLLKKYLIRLPPEHIGKEIKKIHLMTHKQRRKFFYDLNESTNPFEVPKE